MPVPPQAFSYAGQESRSAGHGAPPNMRVVPSDSQARKPAVNDTKKSARGATAGDKYEGFTDEERAAMKERIQEEKALKNRAEGEKAVLAKIATMKGSDRVLGEQVHKIVTKIAPNLIPRLWYGMPAYSKDDSIVCFYQDSQKFKTRYATLGFSDEANLDEGNIWPTAYALKDLTAADQEKIAALVRKAVS